jgi:hypothetical protein
MRCCQLLLQCVDICTELLPLAIQHCRLLLEQQTLRFSPACQPVASVSTFPVSLAISTSTDVCTLDMHQALLAWFRTLSATATI